MVFDPVSSLELLNAFEFPTSIYYPNEVILGRFLDVGCSEKSSMIKRLVLLALPPILLTGETGSKVSELIMPTWWSLQNPNSTLFGGLPYWEHVHLPWGGTFQLQRDIIPATEGHKLLYSGRSTLHLMYLFGCLFISFIINQQ